MKSIIIFILFMFLVVFIGFVPVMGSSSGDSKDAQKRSGENIAEITWEVPIAAGVWYPTDGPVPEKPARYYRVRCWPGCHTGSTYGKYPDKALDDKPIWPTSTINLHSDESSQKN